MMTEIEGVSQFIGASHQRTVEDPRFSNTTSR